MGCGIGGVSTRRPFTEREVEMCYRLLWSLQRRGLDAWGYYDGRRVHKEPGPFYESPKSETLVADLLEAETNLFLCHTRMATKGDPEVNKNNHPFELDPFVFAHNGVLYYSDPFENVWEIETDSFWMLYWIWHEYGLVGETPEAIRRGVTHVSGTYACWLHNMDEEATYLYRIKNPLMETHYWRGRDVVVFGSDWLSIVDALGIPEWRRRLKLWLPEVRILKPRVIYIVRDGVLEEDGTFKPMRLRPRDLGDFWLRQGHLMRYHLPLVSGRGLR